MAQQLEGQDVTTGDEPEDAEMNDEEVENDEEEEEGSEEEENSSSSSGSETDEDNGMAEVDVEVRREVAHALRVSGVAGDSEDDEDTSSSNSYDDILLDDEQMMALDDKLAEIFKSRGVGKSKAGRGTYAKLVKQTVTLTFLVAGLQREATHFKIRVLDFVDTFAEERPESPYTPQIVLPLIRTIMGSGPDEKQLAEKATRILKTRFNTPKNLPCLEPDSKGAMLDIGSLTKDFEHLHRIAKKASLIHTKSVITATNYLAKVLAHAGMQETVTAAYVASIGDFVTRKNSRISEAFIIDFVRRSSPLLSWPLRDKILEACSVGKAINTYRQMASFQILGVFLSSVVQLVCSIGLGAFVH